MKTCILMIGRLDTFEKCYPSLKEFILNPLNADVFFSGYPNKKGLSYCEEKINELWKPKKYLIRKYDDSIRKEVHPNDLRFNDRKRPETKPHNWLSGMYNLKVANNLKKEFEKENSFQYDVCIKARTDLIWHSNIEEEEISLVMEDPDNALIPTAWDFKSIHPLGCSDVTCVTSSEGMNKYSSFIDHVDYYYDRGEVFHPESLTGIHVNHVGLNRISITKGIDPFTKRSNQSGWAVIDPDRIVEY